jgi:nitrogen regulatory protein P-II 1
MKLIKAYMRYRKAEEVFTALKSEGFCCMTFVECEGTGQYSDQEEEHISEKYPFASAYRVIKLEIIARDEHISELISIIKADGGTGYRGDGLIIVSPVDEIYKVRSDEKGVLVLIIWLITRSLNQNVTNNQYKSAIDILKERYARGEIGKDEFEEKKSRLQ